jgi:hypothetical protein
MLAKVLQKVAYRTRKLAKQSAKPVRTPSPTKKEDSFANP